MGCTAALLYLSNSHGARPLVTDDARMVDPKACQIESWVKHRAHSTESWALPACNPLGAIELTLGGAHATGRLAEHERLGLIQGKTLFRSLQAEDWGLGLVVGSIRSADASRTVHEPYFYLPMSVAWKDERFVLHLNLGGTRSENLQRTRATWGIGSETRLSEHTLLIAETYGQAHEQARVHAGIRHWVQLNRVQIDATVGDVLGSGPRSPWITIGLRLLSAAPLRP
jgi:hypothetical protein